MPRGLSKSKIISGMQCPKRLHLSVYQPELADNSGNEVAFSTGNQFGEFARSLFPGGVLATTRALLADDSVRTLFEYSYAVCIQHT